MDSSVDVFKIVESNQEYSVDEKALNAIRWITKLKQTQVKKQQEFLGSARTGYSVLGIGCKALGITTYPDATSSKEFKKAVGLITEYGAFQEAQRYKGIYHKSIYHMGREYSFGRLGAFMQKAKVIRVMFEYEVAEKLLLIFGKKGRKPKLKK